MHALHHAAHKPPLRLFLPHHELPHDVQHTLEHMPRALLQPPLPQALRKDAPAALPRAEPGERASLGIREETRMDGAPRARAVYRAAAPRTPAEAGPSAGRQWWRWRHGRDARGLECVLCACGPRDGGACKGRLVRLRLKCRLIVLTLYAFAPLSLSKAARRRARPRYMAGCAQSLHAGLCRATRYDLAEETRKDTEAAAPEGGHGRAVHVRWLPSRTWAHESQ